MTRFAGCLKLEYLHYFKYYIFTGVGYLLLLNVYFIFCVGVLFRNIIYLKKFRRLIMAIASRGRNETQMDKNQVY